MTHFLLYKLLENACNCVLDNSDLSALSQFFTNLASKFDYSVCYSPFYSSVTQWNREWMARADKVLRPVRLEPCKVFFHNNNSFPRRTTMTSIIIHSDPVRKFPTIAKCHLRGLENLGVQRNNAAVGPWMETVITYIVHTQYCSFEIDACLMIKTRHLWVRRQVLITPSRSRIMSRLYSYVSTTKTLVGGLEQKLNAAIQHFVSTKEVIGQNDA